MPWSPQRSGSAHRCSRCPAPPCAVRRGPVPRCGAVASGGHLCSSGIPARSCPRFALLQYPAGVYLVDTNNTPHGYISATATTAASAGQERCALADDPSSVGRSGLTGERRQQRPHLLVHLRFQPVARHRVVAILDLELVAELVCSAVSAPARGSN